MVDQHDYRVLALVSLKGFKRARVHKQATARGVIIVQTTKINRPRVLKEEEEGGRMYKLPIMDRIFLNLTCVSFPYHVGHSLLGLDHSLLDFSSYFY